MLTFNQLLTPLTQVEWVAFLENALEGVGPVIQGPLPGTNQILGTGTIDVQGPAQTSASVIIKIAASGNAYPLGSQSAATFQYSLDGGLSYAPVTPAAIPANNLYVIPTVNLTIEFANGSYTSAGSGGNCFVVGETYALETTTPTFPVTNWSDVAIGNSLIQIDAQALADLDSTDAQAIAGGFTQSWINPPLINGVPTAPPSGWLDLLAQNRYDLQRSLASFTQGMVALASVAGNATAIQPGGLFFASSLTGYVYTNVNAVVIAPNATTDTLIAAVASGSAYNSPVSYPGLSSPADVITVLLTPVPGVTVTNPLQRSPTVYHTGSGAGTVAIDGSSNPTTDATIVVLITQAGTEPSTGAFQVSLDGGNSFQAPITPIPASYSIGGTGFTIDFAGTFVAGDTYVFSASWITTYGADVQSDLSLATECQNKWPSLSPAGPEGIYQLWAMAASPEVVETIVTKSALYPGQVNLTLVGANNGPVSAAAISAVTAYVLARAPLTVTIAVGTVSTLSIAVTAAYIVVKNQFAFSAPIGITKALIALQDSIPPEGFVYLSAVEEAILSVPGVIEITPDELFLNGVAQDIQLGTNVTAVLVPPPSGSYQFV